MKIIFKLELNMKRNDYYNTKQKELILNILKSQDKDFTIKDIYNELGGKIGLTTIYRFINKLVISGKIKKSINNDNTSYYRYLDECNNKNHFYLKCDKCNKLIHIDCNCINELSNHINKIHNFELNNKNIIINGLCKNCRGNNEKFI